MRIVAFLPAKGSSTRIQSKNLKLLDGKPLFLHTLEKLVASNLFDEVYLDTESQEVVDWASEVGCRVLMRDPKLASNATDGNALFMNEVSQVDAEIYVQILCTSPFIEMSSVSRGIKILTSEPEYDSCVLVRREKFYEWGASGPTYDIENIPNSVDVRDTVVETMGLYIVKREAALATNRRIGDTPFLLEASPLEAIDVNWPEDFDLAELIAAGRREKERKLLANIRNHLSSSMLSDLLDDLGYPNQVISGLSPATLGEKLFGRAKTLKLRKLREGEPFEGIYDALHSYKSIVPNDVIVVENEVSNFAYFGELNANLAIRSGASGVIIDGLTRDVSEVRKIGLPVFSRGYTCQDVRKRATTDYFNKRIVVGGVEVEPECLVYADAEGIVVIPKAIELKIIDEAYAKAADERKILADIAGGADVEALTKNYGFF